jgi:hypothetical protein
MRSKLRFAESRDGSLSDEELEQTFAEARAMLAEFERRSLEGHLEATMALLQVATVH